ncbi:hypothetical protein [Mesobacillus zeae]|uniref:Copper amine oxidase-like N-terminal domain-containing protein n=1 Tax=Mesobacillus zeae TaxID=1917180 RepID=A0A398BKI6_9BACI|nr:hypothetical protein [Mesobacillus zeae]RID87883.1 hypothetical protein D1970_03340 [Mesobacillus zeae]
MRKASIIMLLILIGVFGTVIISQWEAFQEEGRETVQKRERKPSITISVETEKDGLLVKQEVRGLETGKVYRFDYPKMAKEVSCSGKDGRPCERLANYPSSFQIPKKGIIFSYRMAVQEELTSSMFDQWIVQIPDAKEWDIAINVTDKHHAGGSWAAGIPFKGDKQLDLIDYHAFKGENLYPALYWQKNELKNEKVQRGIEVYSVKGKRESAYDFSAIRSLSENGYISVVLGRGTGEKSGSGLIVSEDGILPKILEERVATALITQKIPSLSADERWLIEVLASLYTNQKPNSARAQAVLAELRRKMSEDQLKAFAASFSKENDSVSHQRLDELLSMATGKETRFLFLNKSSNTPFTPLTFFETRTMIVDGKKEGIIMILENGSAPLLPAKEIFSGLGFDVEVKHTQAGSTILLQKDKESYQFFENRSIFLHNGEEYGLLDRPFTVHSGKLFMEPEKIQSIFNVTITGNGEEIRLSHTDGTFKEDK